MYQQIGIKNLPFEYRFKLKTHLWVRINLKEIEIQLKFTKFKKFKN